MPEDSQIPKIGIICYEDTKDENGKIKSASLIFIDSESDSKTSANLTWIAQLEDFSGNGLEVYTEPTAGGGPAIRQTATNENLNFFIDTILAEKEGDAKQKLNEWVETINTSEDLETLLPEEKERLINLIKAKL